MDQLYLFNSRWLYMSSSDFWQSWTIYVIQWLGNGEWTIFM